MPQIKEFRVVLPMTVEEYQVAQLYSVAQASKNETGGGEGIEVLKNEPFTDDPKYGNGQYTHKIYHLASKVPRFIRLLAPKGALEIHEKAWNCYPYCKTVITKKEAAKALKQIILDILSLLGSRKNPDYMKENFYISIETIHSPDRGITENIHNLKDEELKKREVVVINIADPVSSNDYKEEEDPAKYRTVKARPERGPLKDNWMSTVNPVMCAYKLVKCEFKWWGLQNRVENLIMRTEKRIFTNFHRQVFCWTDDWYGMTMADIRAIEDKTKEELDSARQTGSVKGMKETE